MTLRDLVEHYLAVKKGMGEKYRSNGYILRAFCRAVGEQMSSDSVRPKSVAAFLAGTGPLTRTWHRRYTALQVFYRYAQSRSYVKTVPLPTTIPKQPPGLVPYIYSREELCRLLEATASNRSPRYAINPTTLRTILLLLYGAGLRANEALALHLSDVDLQEAVLTVRLSKFFKSRLVPLGPQLNRALIAYSRLRQSLQSSMDGASPLGRATS
jgi:integrase/recombinase XerD